MMNRFIGCKKVLMMTKFENIQGNDVIHVTKNDRIVFSFFCKPT